MKKHTEQELWDFVSRIDTLEKVQIAENYLSKYFDSIGFRENVRLYDELMVSISLISRELHNPKWA